MFGDRRPMGCCTASRVDQSQRVQPRGAGRSRCQLGRERGEAIVGGFIEAGLGRTLANDLLRQGIEAVGAVRCRSSGRERNAATMQTLNAKWGDKAGEKIQLAAA